MSMSILEALEYMRELIRAGKGELDAACIASRLFHVEVNALAAAYVNRP